MTAAPAGQARRGLRKFRDGFGFYLYIPSRGVEGRFRNQFSMYKKMKRLGIE